MDAEALAGLASLAGGLLTPQSPPVQVIVSADCPPNQLLVADPEALELPVLREGMKVVVCRTPKVAAEVTAVIEGAGLELVG